MRDTAASLGYFLGSLAPLLIGVAVSFYLRKKREQDNLPGWPIIVGLVLTILSCAGATTQSRAATLAQAIAAEELGVGQEELGPASMLPDIAKMTPAEVVDANAGIRRGIERAFRERGVAVAPADLNVSSQVVIVAGQGIVKTTVRAPSRFYYQYTGKAKDKAVFVICVSRSGHPFDPSGTECERRVNAVFGPGERG